MGKVNGLVLFLSIVALLIPGVVLSGEGWNTFNQDCQQVLPKFSYPPELVALEKSFKGESRWVYYMQTPNGEFSLISNGFYYTPEWVLQNNETAYDYIWRTLNKEYKGSVTFFKKTEHVIFVVSVKDDLKIFHKVHFSEKDSSGPGINELIIKFPHSKKKLYDKWMLQIEQSWQPSSSCFQQSN